MAAAVRCPVYGGAYRNRYRVSYADQEDYSVFADKGIRRSSRWILERN